MNSRDTEILASQRECRELGVLGVSEVAPSRRDFAQYVATQKQGLAVVARLRQEPSGGEATVIERARAYDEAEVAALSIASGAGALSLQEMSAVAAATTAPIWREALCLDRNQIFAARLHGADAVLLPVAELGTQGLQDMVAVSRSLHMAPVVEVTGEADLKSALTVAHVVLALRCVDQEDRLDLTRTLQLADLVPKPRTTLVLPEVTSIEDIARIASRCDAIVLGEMISQTSDCAALIAQVLELRTPDA